MDLCNFSFPFESWYPYNRHDSLVQAIENLEQMQIEVVFQFFLIHVAMLLTNLFIVLTQCRGPSYVYTVLEKFSQLLYQQLSNMLVSFCGVQ